jgi:hypothetical protein
MLVTFLGRVPGRGTEHPGAFALAPGGVPALCRRPWSFERGENGHFKRTPVLRITCKMAMLFVHNSCADASDRARATTDILTPQRCTTATYDKSKSSFLIQINWSAQNSSGLRPRPFQISNTEAKMMSDQAEVPCWPTNFGLGNASSAPKHRGDEPSAQPAPPELAPCL